MKNAPVKFWNYFSPSKTIISELIDDKNIVEDDDMGRVLNNFFHPVFESGASGPGNRGRETGLE